MHKMSADTFRCRIFATGKAASRSWKSSQIPENERVFSSVSAFPFELQKLAKSGVFQSQFSFLLRKLRVLQPTQGLCVTPFASIPTLPSPMAPRVRKPVFVPCGRCVRAPRPAVEHPQNLKVPSCATKRHPSFFKFFSGVPLDSVPYLG